MLSIAISTSISANNKKIVRLYIDGQEKVISTESDTVSELLNEEDIHLAKDDIVEPNKKTKIKSSGFHINVFRARPILVIDGGKKIKVNTPYQSSELIAKDAGLKTYPEDTLVLDRVDNFTEDEFIGLKLTITRSIPFSIEADGRKISTRTTGETVGEALKKAKIKVSDQDLVTPPQNEKITRGLNVKVTRVTTETIVVDEQIPFSTKVTYVDSQPISWEQQDQAGKNGLKTVTHEVTKHDGQEASRKTLKEIIRQKPVERILQKGKKIDGFSGSFAEALSRLRSCEGSYTSNTGNGYYGAYQFDIRTWGGFGGYANASQAPPEVQDQKAWLTYTNRGWSPWPSCSRTLGLQDIYR